MITAYILRYFGQFYTVDLLLPYYMYYTEVARHNLGGKIYIFTSNTFYELGFDPQKI